MWRYILVLAICSNSALGGFNPNDRQLQQGADQGTGNDWQYCEDQCNEVCEGCEEHRECGPDETKCGEGPTKLGKNGLPLVHCKKDDICVDDDCFCKLYISNKN